MSIMLDPHSLPSSMGGINNVSSLTPTKRTKKVKIVKEGKRKPTAYNNFVKEKMSTANIKALPHKERMKAIGQEWRASK